MSSPSEDDWLEIHKKAWKDPDFKAHLESDPTGALHSYAESVGKKFTQLVKMPEEPNAELAEFIDENFKAPPACC